MDSQYVVGTFFFSPCEVSFCILFKKYSELQKCQSEKKLCIEKLDTL